MACKIKLKQSKTRRPRGLHALTDRADRAAAHLVGCIGEHERAEAGSELAFYDAQTATEKVEELDAANVVAMDHVGDLLDALHADLDSIEEDLDAFIKGGK